MTDPIIKITGLQNYLGKQWVHKDLNLTVNRGEIVAIIGGSGSGKTTIFQSMLMLIKPTHGTIEILNQNIQELSTAAMNLLRRRWGVLFQHSALFSTLTVIENILFPMREFTSFTCDFLYKLAMLKINLVGLTANDANKFPIELSGGMQRRVATARAIAMDPELLFLDEPTTGLDPKSARQFDDLILFLRHALKLTVVMISHDLESLKKITDRVAFVGEGKILAIAPLEELMQDKHPLIMEYFNKN